MVYVLLADGFEEVEALTPVDLLRRAGVDVQTVGVTGKTVCGSHGIAVSADVLLAEMQLAQMTMLVLPGGLTGTENLAVSEDVQRATRFCLEQDRYLAAICAAPSVVLGKTGVLEGKRATCYPGMEDGMQGAIPQNAPVCVDGKIVTGRAVGAAMEFGLTLCALLAGQETADRLRQACCVE